jgi:hypothetical protein
MKTLPVITFAAAVAILAAFVLSPLTFEVSLSILFGLGLAAIVAADYTRTFRPLKLNLTATPAPAAAAAGARTERFGLAA